MVNKSLFGFFAVLILLNSSIVIAEEATSVKEFPEIAMFNREGVLATRYSRRAPICGNGVVESGEECELPNEQYITDPTIKSKCIEILNNAPAEEFDMPKDQLDFGNPICGEGCLCSAVPKPEVTTPSGSVSIECTDTERQRIIAEIQKIISKVRVGGPNSDARKDACAKQQMYKDMIARLISQSKCPDIDPSRYQSQIDSLCSNFPLKGGTSGQKPSGWGKAGGVIGDGVKQVIPFWKWLRKGLKGVGIGGCGVIMSSPSCAYPGDDCIVQEVGDILGGPVTWGGGLVEGLVRGIKGKCNDKCECISKEGYDDDLDEAIDEALQ